MTVQDLIDLLRPQERDAQVAIMANHAWGQYIDPADSIELMYLEDGEYVSVNDAEDTMNSQLVVVVCP